MSKTTKMWTLLVGTRIQRKLKLNNTVSKMARSAFPSAAICFHGVSSELSQEQKADLAFSNHFEINS